MKKIACVEPGIIVHGTLLKNGDISEKDRRDVTQECIIAMMQHLSCFEAFSVDGVSGYEWSKSNDDNSKVQLVLFDTSKYMLVPNRSGIDEE